MYFCTCRVMSAPPRKSRRIAARRPPQTNAPMTDQGKTTATNASSTCTSELIKSQINAAIPAITNSVISALSAHGFIFPDNSTADRQQPTQTHIIHPSCSTSLAATTTLNNITPSQSIIDRDNYTAPVFSQTQALFTNISALNAVNSTSVPTLSTVMSPSVYQLPSLNSQLYPLPATHSSQQTTESGLHSHSTSFTVPSNDILGPSGVRSTVRRLFSPTVR